MEVLYILLSTKCVLDLWIVPVCVGPTSSSFPIEIGDHFKYGTCFISSRTKIEPPGRFNSTDPMPITRIGLKFLVL